MAERRGDQRTALALVRRAADDGAQAVPFYRAHLLSDQARLELVAGERSQAARAATTALNIYRRLGAATYLDRPHLKIDQSDPGGKKPTETAAEPVTQSLRILGARFGLSDRELDVLTLLAGGLSMKQIAQELFITASTVSFHLGRIYSKAGVHSRHQLPESSGQSRCPRERPRPRGDRPPTAPYAVRCHAHPVRTLTIRTSHPNARSRLRLPE